MPLTPLRVKATAVAEELARNGVGEEGGNNRGPWIRSFLQATDLGLEQGAPWCAAFVSYCLKVAGINVAKIRHRAAVYYWIDYAKAHGYLVKRPFRGDLFCIDFDGDGRYDHIGFVAKVLGGLNRLSPVLVLKTVEGNTSSGLAGSQDDGDGVFVRRRVFRKKHVFFIRIPDEL